jgi:hypothetical protein
MNEPAHSGGDQGQHLKAVRGTGDPSSSLALLHTDLRSLLKVADDEDDDIEDDPALPERR